MKTHKVRPVLTIGISTNEPNNIHIESGGKMVLVHGSYIEEQYNIILISLEDEKIKIGNKFWYRNYKLMTCTGLSKSGQILVDNQIAKHDNYGYPQSLCKKVIAIQSQLSPELIQQLIDEYNNGGMKDFNVEMEDFISANPIWKRNDLLSNVVIRPLLTNGFITIVSKPKLYTEEDMNSFANWYIKNARAYSSSEIALFDGTYLKDWLKENKKK